MRRLITQNKIMNRIMRKLCLLEIKVLGLRSQTIQYFKKRLKKSPFTNFPDSRDLSCDPWREPDPYICNLDSTTKLE